jgi:hypothetical protein
MQQHLSCRLRGTFLLLLAAGGTILLTGCQTTVQQAVKKSLTPEEIKAIEAGRKSVVLVRVTSTEARDQESLGHTMDVRWNIWNVSDWQDRQLLVKPEDSAPSLFWRVPSEELGKAGWRYLVLEPGRYFMKVRPDEGVVASFPVYHVSIPPGPRPVYVGSFRFVPTNAISRVSHGKEKTYPGFAFKGLSDETGEAREAGKNLSVPPSRVITRLAVPDDLAAALPSYAGQRILAVEITNRLPHVTKYVGHKAGTLVGAPFALTGAFLISLAVCDDNDDDDIYYYQDQKHDNLAVDMSLFCGGLIFIAAAVPIAYLGDATVGSISRMNWKPHEAAMSEKIMDFNLARHLTNSLLAALSGTNSTASNETNKGAGLVVHVDVYRAGLEPENYLAWNYTFEIQVYLSVTEVGSDAVLWEHGYVYCHSALKRKNVPFATLVKNADKASPLKTYKGQPGRNRVQEQLEDAATRLGDEIAAHFKAAGF